MNEQISIFDLSNVSKCQKQYDYVTKCYEDWKRSLLGSCSYENKIALADKYEQEKARLFSDYNCDFVAGKNFSEEYIYDKLQKD